MKKIFISIVMATYNRANFIRDAIYSVLNQTYSDFEFIIIDDGSTDNTKQIVNDLNDSRIVYIKKEHTTCWDSKNKGIVKANGEYILFIDSDDFISSNYLAQGINSINKFRDYDYIYPEKLPIVREDLTKTNSNWRYIDISLEERWKLINIFLTQGISAIPHPGAFVKKNIYIENGFFNGNLYNFGDSDFIVRNALKVRFKMDSNLKYYYNRQHSKQTNKNWKHRSEVIASLMEYIVNHYPYSFYLQDIKKYRNEEELKYAFSKLYFNCLLKQSKKNSQYKLPFILLAKNHINYLNLYKQI